VCGEPRGKLVGNVACLDEGEKNIKNGRAANGRGKRGEPKGFNLIGNLLKEGGGFPQPKNKPGRRRIRYWREELNVIERGVDKRSGFVRRQLHVLGPAEG